jgi:phage repressor protein C with HTH and peptisase S24 domain
MLKLEHGFILKSKQRLLFSKRYSHYHKAMLNQNFEERQRLALAARVKEAISSKPRGIKTEISHRLNISPTAITGWEKNGRISKESIEVVAEMTGYSLSWLISGKGEKLQKTPIINTASHNRLQESPPSYVLGQLDLWDSKTPLRDDEVALPFFREVELAAGSGRHEVVENHGLKLRFARSTLKRKGIIESNAACVTVSGDSMSPVLPGGCVIGIDKGNTSIKDGDTYAIIHNGELRVKRIYKLPGGGIRLRSWNIDEWPDENYTMEEAHQQITILGRMFWSSTLW